MAIIRKHRPFVPVEAMLRGLGRAAAGVLRVALSPGSGAGAKQALCTAWLVTDDLAVVPDLAIFRPYPDSFVCYAASAPDAAIPATAIVALEFGSLSDTHSQG